MYDGTNFMGIKGYDQCQFFESDVILGASGDSDNLFNDRGSEYMKACPKEDTCCFSLREYMSIDFWGRKYNRQRLKSRPTERPTANPFRG